MAARNPYRSLPSVDRLLLDERVRALADRRAEEVPVSELTHEAHPAVERIRARILGRPPRP